MDIVQGTSSNHEGYLLFLAIQDKLLINTKVKLSLRDLTPLSTSFLHSSFGELFEKFGYARIKSSIVLVDYKKSDALKIRMYIQDILSMKSST